MVSSHTLSPSGSAIGAQPPHQPLNVPFTSGVVYGSKTSFISTMKVTLNKLSKLQFTCQPVIHKTSPAESGRAIEG
jgi:hypothetical protein